ncbi:TIGR02186 family protein [Paracoccus aerodenitrificans]|uniref:TIGR02186 family protein n=1 Tax=Paracoccus aerodenitrificans TaxID=3017781 RepID=UPI0022EFF51B|nr:TIGR02186 family protein [Paracoccus aerodenitrificans]WBU65092.1 TIGR02186 family protein [Paracoccus aerodenitrificans]
MRRIAILLAFLIAAPVAGQETTRQADPAQEEFPIMSFPSPESTRGEPPERPHESAEQVVAGISSDAVSITTSFDGSEIIIFGAVRRETPIPMTGPLNVIVTVEGPSRSVTVRRKQRKLGIWVNTESVVVGAAPSFYSVASTGTLGLILDEDEDARYRISIPTAMRAFARPVDVEDPVDFTEAMIVSRIADGTYRLKQNAVRLVEDTLFRADFRLPANLVEGSYKTRIFLVRQGRVIDSYSAPLEVRKVGLERWLYRLAFDRPFAYGLMSLLIAAFAGWGASAAFRALQRN